MSDLAKQIVDEAILEVNADQDADAQVANQPDTALLSEGSNVDSLALVRLLLAVERLIEEKTGKAITVVDDTAFETEESPFATVGTLLQHVTHLLA
jgi:hypothetical protein